jgi:hypothetical protein
VKVQHLRPALDAAGMAATYPRPHRVGTNSSHLARVEMTVAFAKLMGFGGDFGLVADLSCGDAAITDALCTYGKSAILGDFAPGYPICGPIEETIHDVPHVSGFILSETLEHLDDPNVVLAAIRGKADRLLLATPIGCWDDDNPEHYWAWDREFVEHLAGLHGWKVDGFCSLDRAPFGGWYIFGIWVMS